MQIMEEPHLLPTVIRYQDVILEEAKIYAEDYHQFLKN